MQMSIFAFEPRHAAKITQFVTFTSHCHRERDYAQRDQCCGSFKGLVTLETLERFLAGVNTSVRLERGELAEGPATEIANVRLVRAPVHGQVRRGGPLRTTDFALVPLLCGATNETVVVERCAGVTVGGIPYCFVLASAFKHVVQARRKAVERRSVICLIVVFFVRSVVSRQDAGRSTVPRVRVGRRLGCRGFGGRQHLKQNVKIAVHFFNVNQPAHLTSARCMV